MLNSNHDPRADKVHKWQLTQRVQSPDHDTLMDLRLPSLDSSCSEFRGGFDCLRVSTDFRHL